MANKGLALMGTGIATGPERAIKAATDAISSPLLEDITIDGATGIIVNITGNSTLSMHETNEAMTLIMEAADEDAEIIFGTVVEEDMGEEVKVTVIATGLGGGEATVQAARETFTANTVTETRPAPAMAEMMAPVTNTEEIRREEVRVDTIAPTYETAPAVEPRVEETYEPAPVATEAPRAEAYTAQAISTNTSTLDNFLGDARETEVTEHRIQTEAQAVSEAVEEPTVTVRSTLSDSLRDAAHSYRSAAVEREEAPAQVEPARAETPSKAKSIAEKLGFMNFDDDEFDTPSYMRKEEPRQNM